MSTILPWRNQFPDDNSLPEWPMTVTRLDDGGYTATGTCPKCGHTFVYSWLVQPQGGAISPHRPL